MSRRAGGPPERIFVIRHAEKPPPTAEAPFGIDVDGKRDEHSLVPRGWQRSGALVALFAPAVGPTRPGLAVPGHLICPDYGADIGRHRTYQTIQGIGALIGVAVDSPFAQGAEQELADSVVAGYAGTVLICWDHHRIPTIAAAVPLASGVVPAAWPDDRFDLIWSFALSSAPGPPSYDFVQVPQLLLAGDAATS